MIKKITSFVADMVKKRHRSRLRQIMRGYRSLKQAGHLARIAALKQALTTYQLKLSERGLAEISVRQYLLIRVGDLNLNRALLLALGKKRGRVVFHLPEEWREILSQHGFEVAHFRSALLWQLYIFMLLFYGILQVVEILLAGRVSERKPDQKIPPHAYFPALVTGNLPQTMGSTQSHDVISWYLQWAGRVKDIRTIYHSVISAQPIEVGNISVETRQGPLPALRGVIELSKFSLWGFYACISAAVNWLRGRWWHALLLNQSALAAQARILPAAYLAREYMFHNSGWVYRPLWTYEAERKGSVITFYFYSTNCEVFKRSDGYPPVTYGWGAATWPHYLVWDDHQADFVRRAVGQNAKTSVVGPIWFQSSAVEMYKIDKPGVAVFDVAPHRASQYCTLGLDSEFYAAGTAESFLEHIANAVNELEVPMLWKRKRDIGKVAHPHYRYIADRLSASKWVTSIVPTISPFRVIESSCAVISMPFTSTALIAREMGKPSAYYDPTMQLQGDDRAAHGIPIISGPDELKTWLASHVRSHS